MERGEYRVSLDTLFRLLDIFQLVTAFVRLEPATDQHLEAQLVDGFRKLDAIGQQHVLDYLDGVLKHAGARPPGCRVVAQ